MADRTGRRIEGIVVVSGVPGSGKTTLAGELAPTLGLPLIAKDTIKEALFDVLGTGDLGWSRDLGRASHAVMYALASQARSCVLESFFWPGTSEPDLHGLSRPLIQVYCDCPLDLAVQRYLARRDDPDRHRGHLGEHQTTDAIAGWAGTDPRPLALDAPLVRVPTAAPVDLAGVVAEIHAVTESSASPSTRS